MCTWDLGVKGPDIYIPPLEENQNSSGLDCRVNTPSYSIFFIFTEKNKKVVALQSWEFFWRTLYIAQEERKDNKNKMQMQNKMQANNMIKIICKAYTGNLKTNTFNIITIGDT